jgi:hypothetical protein
MAATKSSTTRKASTKKSTTRKSTTAKTRTARTKRTRQPAPELTQQVRTAAGAALGIFEERLMDQEGTGYMSSATRELKGTRSGFQKTVRMEDEDGKRTQAVITVVFKARTARVGKRTKKTAAVPDDSE